MAVTKSSSSSVSRSPRPAASTAKKSSSSSPSKTSSSQKTGRGTTKTSNPSKTSSTHKAASSTATQGKARTTESQSVSKGKDSFQPSAELREERAAKSASEETGHHALMAGLVSNYRSDGTGSESAGVTPVSGSSKPGEGQATEQAGSAAAVSGNSTAPSQATSPAESTRSVDAVSGTQATQQPGNGQQTPNAAQQPGNGQQTPNSAQQPGNGQPTADAAQPPANGQPTADATQPPANGQQTPNAAQQPGNRQPTAGATQPPADGQTTGPDGQPLGPEGQQRADQARALQTQVEEAASKATVNQTPTNEAVDQLRQQLGDPPKLDNVLTVHGLFADASTFNTMTQYWTSTGVNQMGGTINGQDLQGMTRDQIRSMDPAQLAQRLNLNPQGNIYNMQFAQNSAQTDQNREQLGLATEVVSRLRGGGQVDLVAHSKGGIDSRNLIDSGGGERVRSLTMLGTPNRGSGVAELAQSTLGSLGADAFAGDRAAPGHPALGELSRGSQTTESLNQRLQQQIAALGGRVLAVQGATLAGGDGVVSYNSAAVPGAINRTAWNAAHIDNPITNSLTNSPSVIGEVSNFLAGRPLSPSQDLFDGAGGRALQAVSNGYDATVNAVGDAANMVGNTAVRGWEGARYYGNQAYEGTVNGLQRGWEGTQYYANQGWEGARYYGNQAYEGTIRGANSAYDATVSGAGRAYDAVTTGASDAWNYLLGR